MSTASLRKDHDLQQVIDFSMNFTDVCHHSKEEGSLFPSLERAGMPKNMGPIAMMLMDHERSREIAKRMDTASKKYLESGNSDDLINTMDEYTQHITEHLWKENNRLFLMAEARLAYVSSQVNQELHEIEKEKLKELGKSRQHYEDLAENLTKHVSGQ